MDERTRGEKSAGRKDHGFDKTIEISTGGKVHSLSLPFVIPNSGICIALGECPSSRLWIPSGWNNNNDILGM